MALVIPPRRARSPDSRVWRVGAAVPAVVGSLLLLLVVFAPLGAWEGLVLLAWLSCGAAGLTAVTEAAVVRVWCGFRPPSAAQAVALGPAWAEALRRCQVPAGDVDLYVQHTATVNAYAVGARSVAVTSGAIKKLAARRLGHDDLVAVLAHELGHLAASATRLALLKAWLTAPWRLAARVVLVVAYAAAGSQPRRLLAMVIAAGVVVAVVQAVHAHRWATALVLGAVATAGVLCPLVDAAAARRSEYDADRYAAAAGLGPQLADALRRLDPVEAREPRGSRLRSRHPDIGRRRAALKTTRPAG